tara:strand:- start:893 stop:2392 length:1500 start_codon:yes stop_codon:yes gene_type:complete
MKISYPAVLDGGLSYPLEKNGFNIKKDLWVSELLISNPKAIKNAHIDYLNSGAEILTSSSYQASFNLLKNRGYNKSKSKKIILKSIEILNQVKKNTNKNFIIAASIGPYGSSLADGSEYRGINNVSDKKIYEFYKDKVDVLDKSSANLLAFETIPSFKETKVILRILKNTKKMAWISFSCRNDKEINDGTSIEKCCELLKNQPKVFAIGINCTSPIYISKLIRIIKKNTHKKIIIYPNSGEKYDGEKKIWKGNVINPFESYIDEWLKLGVDILGGCCRIGPKEIKKIKSKVDTFKIEKHNNFSKQFEKLKSDPIMEFLISKFGKNIDIMDRYSPNYSKAISNLIIEQQISFKAAITIKKKFNVLIKNLTNNQIIKLSTKHFQSIGISKIKIEYIKNVYKFFKTESDNIKEMSDEEVIQFLTKIKGVGKWTAEMFLIFNLFRMNVFSNNDLALINSIKINYGIKNLTEKKLKKIVSLWEPYKTIASLLLWKSIEEKIFYK